MNELSGIDDYIYDSMQAWHAPGVALAVVKDGEVILKRGYGFRNVEEELPVTPSTMFPLASITKSFTAMGVALLVDEGKLAWDTPVRDYLPWFRLEDDYVTAHLTVRDLLCHRSGLPRHDMVWYGSDFSREELVRKLAHLKANKGFRSTYQYQNIMFAAAGYLTGHVVGSSWEAFIQERIFDVLEMSASNISPEAYLASTDHATGYKESKGEVTSLPYRDFVNTAPAGSINSNLEDMLSWLHLHLHGGKHKGKVFVSETNLTEMHTPQMLVRTSGLYKKLFGTPINTYGLGWHIQPYRGYTLIHHGGNIDGFSTFFSFIPEANLGSVILTNIQSKPLRRTLPFTIYDRLLGLPASDWDKRYLAVFAESDAAQDRQEETLDAERVPDTQPSHALADYIGTYEHPGYADFVVGENEGQLTGTYAGEVLPLTHYHYDTFELFYELYKVRLKITFLTDTKGNISAAVIPIESAVDPVTYARKPEAVSKEVLEQLPGTYDTSVEGTLYTVRLSPQGVLYGRLSGQPEAELQPYRGTEFRSKANTNTTAEFVQEDGQFNRVLLKLTGGTYDGKRISP